MNDQGKNVKPRSRVKQKSNKIFYGICILTIFFVTIFYFYTKQHSLDIYPNSDNHIISGTEKTSDNNNSGFHNSSEKKLQSQREDLEVDNIENTDTIPSTKDSPFSTGELVLQSSTEQVFSSSEEDIVKDNDPEYLIKELNTFYEHLDQQSYMKDFNLELPSRVHFSNLLQRLINNPPVVTNETNDLFTLLKNTAHFFRILGKDNILILKGILDREKPVFEHILQTFYALTYFPEVMSREYFLILPKTGLYNYAGFFLNTMGGRLYLFRRDSASRMTVSFYAIMIIDRANDEGYNRYGIDFRSAIDFLIDEIENSGNRLILKEKYLNTLYNLKEKYN